MEHKGIEIGIHDAMDSLNLLFNASACPTRQTEIQFVFEEAEGEFPMRLSIRDGKSRVLEGIAEDPGCELRTDLRCWNDISGGYLSFGKAVLRKRLRFKGNPFLLRRLYGGTEDWPMPPGLYKGGYRIEAIRKVMILSCSPRAERGATHAAVERLAAGMRRAGASVEILFPARMKIKPCIGCFRCWEGEHGVCVFHEADEMRIILDKYRSVDLVVWATPIYHYFGSTAMKTVMDRLFVNADSHIIKSEGQFRHPRKMERLPYYAVLALGGFPDMGIFEPLKRNFRDLARHTGIKLIGEIYRHTSMPFNIEGLRIKKKDDALLSIEEAGVELIELKRIRRATKRGAERKIARLPLMLAAANAMKRGA